MLTYLRVSHKHNSIWHPPIRMRRHMANCNVSGLYDNRRLRNSIWEGGSKAFGPRGSMPHLSTPAHAIGVDYIFALPPARRGRGGVRRRLPPWKPVTHVPERLLPLFPVWCIARNLRVASIRC